MVEQSGGFYDDLWANSLVTRPDGRQQRMIHLDQDVFEWFRENSPDAEDQVGEILRYYGNMPRQGEAPTPGEPLDNPVVSYPGGPTSRMVRVDLDVFEAYRQRGDDFELQMNEVLRSYSQVPRKEGPEKAKHAG